MSRYRQTMSELLKQVRGIKEQDEKDHEISMARGELEAIADKATQLASALQGKSDDGNPLEAWVQSKITKAKDYINSVSDYLMYNPDMKQNEELEESDAYDNNRYMMKKYMGQVLARIDNSNTKDGKDHVYAPNAQIAKQLYKQGKKVYREETLDEKTYGWTLVSKAKDLAKKFANNYTKAVDEIEKLEKGLSKNPTVEKELMKYNESVDNYPTKDMNDKKHSAYKDPKKGERKIVDPQPKLQQTTEDTLDEAKLKDIFMANQEGKKTDEIAKKLGMSVADVKKILGEDNVKDVVEFTSSQIKDLQKSYADLKGKTISPEKATALSKHLDRIDLQSLRQLLKANIPFVSTLARNKIYRKTGKFEELEEKKMTVKKGDKVRVINDFEWRTYSQMGYKLVGKDGQPMKEDRYAGARSIIETITAVKNKAEKTGMPYSILKKVYDRGMAAWKGGHRPGATQQQWALARVNSFVTKSSGTWGGADKDLAAKVRGSKK